MLTFIRSASIAPGKTIEAITFAKQIATHIHDRYGTTIGTI
jgi:hypothetical protein